MPQRPPEIISRPLIERRCRGQCETQLMWSGVAEIYGFRECASMTESYELLSFYKNSKLMLHVYVTLLQCYIIITSIMLPLNRKLTSYNLHLWGFLVMNHFAHYCMKLYFISHLKPNKLFVFVLHPHTIIS